MPKADTQDFLCGVLTCKLFYGKTKAMTPSTIFFIVALACVLMFILLLVGRNKVRFEQRKLAGERANNPSLSHPPPRYSTKRIRNIRIVNLLLIPFYVIVFLIPFLYIWMAEIPPFEKLHVTIGELTYQDVGRGNRLTGIKTASGTELFTCSKAVYYGGHPDCLFPMSEYERLSGQPAKVWWYKQSGYLFSTQNRLVKLEVAGKEIVSYGKTVELTQKASNSAPWFMFMILAIFSLIVAGQEQQIRSDRKISGGAS